MLGVERCVRQVCIGFRFVVGGDFFRPKLERLAHACVGQAVDGKTQIGKHLIVDDIVQEYRIRIENVLRQNDALVK